MGPPSNEGGLFLYTHMVNYLGPHKVTISRWRDKYFVQFLLRDINPPNTSNHTVLDTLEHANILVVAQATKLWVKDHLNVDTIKRRIYDTDESL